MKSFTGQSLSGIFLSTTLVVALGCSIGCNSKTSPENAATTSAPSVNLQSVTFYVDGMVWGKSWTTAVEKQLNELPGVAEASTNMELQTATIRFDPAVMKPTDAIDAFTGRFQLSIYEGEIE